MKALHLFDVSYSSVVQKLYFRSTAGSLSFIYWPKYPMIITKAQAVCKVNFMSWCYDKCVGFCWTTVLNWTVTTSGLVPNSMCNIRSKVIPSCKYSKMRIMKTSQQKCHIIFKLEMHEHTNYCILWKFARFKRVPQVHFNVLIHADKLNGTTLPQWILTICCFREEYENHYEYHII